MKGMDRKGKEFQRLTAEDIRKCKGFERRTDEEVKEIILTLEKLSLLIYKKFNKTKSAYEQAP